MEGTERRSKVFNLKYLKGVKLSFVNLAVEEFCWCVSDHHPAAEPKQQTDGQMFSHSISGKEQNSRFRQLRRVSPELEAAKEPQIITLPPPCLTAGEVIVWNVVLISHQMKLSFQKKKIPLSSPDCLCQIAQRSF